MIFHSIWLGGELPAEYRGYQASWCRLNPRWEHRLWTEANMPLLQNQVEFDRARSYSQKADIARLELLFRYGGVYVDTDFECLRALEPVIGGLPCWMAREREPDGLVANSIMGSVAGHPFFKLLIESLPESFAAPNSNDSVDVSTGPGLITRMYEKAASERCPVPTLLPSTYFFPYSWDQRYRKFETFHDSYAVHHWGSSWWQGTRREKLRRFLLRSRLTGLGLRAYHELQTGRRDAGN